jgi:hypothetical protein
MLSDSDIMKLGTAIAEATSNDLSDPGARMFAASLNPEITLNDALSLIVEWNGLPHFGNQLRPTDLNELWKQRKPASKLTENQITDLLIAQGLEGDALWAGAAPAMVCRLVNQGMTLGQAVSKASARWRGHELPASEHKPRKHIGHHFAGRLDRMNIHDVLGETS